MFAPYGILLAIEWLLNWLIHFVFTQKSLSENNFRRLSLAMKIDQDELNINDQVSVITIGFKYRKKPNGSSMKSSS